MSRFIDPQKITNELPLSVNEGASQADYTFVKKTPDGWNVCATTKTGARHTHFHAFPTQERATKFADKVLAHKTLNLNHWREMGRFD